LIRCYIKEISEFLDSVGITGNLLATHEIEINEYAPPMVDVFSMNRHLSMGKHLHNQDKWCFLPDVIFTKSEWAFKFLKDEFTSSFIISGHAICVKLLSTDGLKHLPKNLLNLCCSGYEVEALNEHFQELKNYPSLKSIRFNNCKNLKDISLLKNLANLQSLDLSGCNSLADISGLSGLVNLQSLNLSDCESLADINGLSGLVNLQSLDLSGCASLTDISSLSDLLSLQSLDLSYSKSLEDISGLSGLVNLQSLDLSSCVSLTNIESLSGLVKLQFLYLTDCESLKDISVLSWLENLQSLNLNQCISLTDINPLSSLIKLQSLDLAECIQILDINSLENLKNLTNLSLHGCLLVTDIKSLSGLVNLEKLYLGGCISLVDIASLSGLLNLKFLDLWHCKSLTDISSLAGLLNLQSLELNSCELLADIRSLSGLLNLETLNLNNCQSLTDRSSLAGLLNLQTLYLGSMSSFEYQNLEDINFLSGLLDLKKLHLSYCVGLADISILSKLLNLETLSLSCCKLLTDISSLSGLVNLQSLDLDECNLLTDISCLSKLMNLETLDLEGCKRILDYSSLKNCLALKLLKENNMHPAESAELLCFLAVQRKDISFISEKFNSWLQELKLGFRQKHSSSNDLACSLAKGGVLANLEEAGLSFHQTLLNHPNVGISPWKIWFSENLKTYGWDKIQNLAELNKQSELTFGSIGGISSCLPSLEGDPVQIGWAKKWILEIHSLHNTNPNFLEPAAAEWCLALKRLGEDELLREWIKKFTDPSDLSALDPINKVFSAYALDLNDSEFALEYALKVNDPKLRDESILNLAQQFIKEGETTKAGEFLFLLTQIESRTQLAYSLAEDTTYLKSDENAHRLLAACGDNPQSLASILDKLRLANPASEILEIMHEKLGNEIRFSLSNEAIALEAVVVISKLSKVTDPTFLNDAKKAMETLLKNKPNYV
jgi:Leucine-rich repeat (LRR) protein